MKKKLMICMSILVTSSLATNAIAANITVKATSGCSSDDFASVLVGVSTSTTGSADNCSPNQTARIDNPLSNSSKTLYKVATSTPLTLNSSSSNSCTYNFKSGLFGKSCYATVPQGAASGQIYLNMSHNATYKDRCDCTYATYYAS